MKINTSRFGEVECQEEHVFNFVEGPLGFPQAKSFIILNHPNTVFFKWLQSVDDPDLAFVITNPFHFFPDYVFDIPNDDVELLNIKDRDKLLIFTILVMPPDAKKITANLTAPIIFNGENRKGKQLVLVDNRYGTKHFIFSDQEE